MVETAYFFDGINYDEAAQADFQQRVLRPEGIFSDSPFGATTVTATNGNMSVTVNAGEAMLRGFYYRNGSPKVLTIAANASGSTRIDVIVLRLDRAANSLVAAVLQGIPGAGTPALTQTALGVWEFPLASVTVANAASSIVAGNLADQRAYSRWPLLALDTAMATDAEVTAAVAAGVLTETNNRIAGDNAEAATRAANDTAESNSRIAGDNALAVLAPKAWGRIFGGAVTTFQGSGIASITYLGVGQKVITWTNAFPNANYTVLISMHELDRKFYIPAQSTTQLSVYTYDLSTVAQNPVFSVAVFG